MHMYVYICNVNIYVYVHLHVYVYVYLEIKYPESHGISSEILQFKFRDVPVTLMCVDWMKYPNTPIPSMGRLYIYLHEWLIFVVHVGKYININKYTIVPWMVWDKHLYNRDTTSGFHRCRGYLLKSLQKHKASMGSHPDFSEFSLKKFPGGMP